MVVIENDGTLEELRDIVDRAWMESVAKRVDAGYLHHGYKS